MNVLEIETPDPVSDDLLDTATVPSPIGPIRLLATPRALVAVRLPESGSGTGSPRAPVEPEEERPGETKSSGRRGGGEPEPATARGEPRKHAILDEAVREMEAYFAGELRSFSVPIAFSGSPFEGTPFQTEVWRGLLSIPYGESRSYAWLAEQIDRPGAYRAVGAANGRNPLAIVVPCHRVIGADGSLTGYGGGLEAKRWLLDHEAAQADLFSAT